MQYLRWCRFRKCRLYAIVLKSKLCLNLHSWAIKSSLLYNLSHSGAVAYIGPIYTRIIYTMHLIRDLNVYGDVYTKTTYNYNYVYTYILWVYSKLWYCRKHRNKVGEGKIKWHYHVYILYDVKNPLLEKIF